MKTLAFFILVGIAGAVAGAAGGGGLAARIIPDAGAHGPWYASRATGFVCYLCIWFSLVGGLLMSSAWFDGIVGRARLLALHQTAGVAGVALGFAHALVLIPDEWTEFGVADLFIPFASYYEPLAAGVGTLTLYLAALVTFSFWFRGRIGIRAWRYIHYLSVVVFFGALWHGLQLGTDSKEQWAMAIYLGTSLSLVLGLVIRLTYARPQRARVQPPAVAV